MLESGPFWRMERAASIAGYDEGRWFQAIFAMSIREPRL